MCSTTSAQTAEDTTGPLRAHRPVTGRQKEPSGLRKRQREQEKRRRMCGNKMSSISTNQEVPFSHTHLILPKRLCNVGHLNIYSGFKKKKKKRKL